MRKEEQDRERENQCVFVDNGCMRCPRGSAYDLVRARARVRARVHAMCALRAAESACSDDEHASVSAACTSD